MHLVFLKKEHLVKDNSTDMYKLVQSVFIRRKKSNFFTLQYGYRRGTEDDDYELSAFVVTPAPTQVTKSLFSKAMILND